MVKSWKYHNLIALFSILIITIMLFHFGILEQWVKELEHLGYFGIIILGIFFVSTFTAVPAATMLVLMSEDMNIFMVAVFAGLGGAIGDCLTHHFIEDGLAHEIEAVFRKMAGNSWKKFDHIIHTRHFARISLVIGELILVSPIPDEIGLGFMSIYHLGAAKLFTLTFGLHSIYILILLSVIELFI